MYPNALLTMGQTVRVWLNYAGSGYLTQVPADSDKYTQIYLYVPKCT